MAGTKSLSADLSLTEYGRGGVGVEVLQLLGLGAEMDRRRQRRRRRWREGSDRSCCDGLTGSAAGIVGRGGGDPALEARRWFRGRGTRIQSPEEAAARDRGAWRRLARE